MDRTPVLIGEMEEEVFGKGLTSRHQPAYLGYATWSLDGSLLVSISANKYVFTDSQKAYRHLAGSVVCPYEKAHVSYRFAGDLPSAKVLLHLQSTSTPATS